MLSKGAGKDQATQLRAILLCEAQFNQNNKLTGRVMMRNLEKHCTVAKEQCGSRKLQSSDNHALNKALMFDILRSKKIVGAHRSLSPSLLA